MRPVKREGILWRPGFGNVLEVTLAPAASKTGREAPAMD
jgi:hypothetical protein